MAKDDAPLVWSSEQGRICPGCGKAVKQCCCRKAAPSSAGDGIVRVRRETKGRGGKTVTVVSGLPLQGEELKAVAGELKKRCGTGGTIKEGTVEIQGDHRDTILAWLTAKGYKAKPAGG